MTAGHSTLTTLRSVAHAAGGMDDAVFTLVAQARQEGCSWGLIGAALGVTRQAAYARYAHRMSGVEDVPTPSP